MQTPTSVVLAVLFAQSLFGQSISLIGRRDIPAGTNPYGTAVGDFNGDGKPDIAATNTNVNTVSLMLGNGDGSFQLPKTKSVGGGPRGLAAADINRDGRLDLAVANTGSSAVSILLGKGDGTFQDAISYPTGPGPIAVALVDLNGDGKLDLVTANNGANSISVLLGNGDGTFRPAQTYFVGDNPTAVVAGDINGDGKQDLAVPSYALGSVSILIGNGDGSFQGATTVTVGSNPAGAVLADLTGDGKLDLATANAGSANVSVLAGNGDGTFQPAANIAVGSTPYALAAADLDGDHVLDLVVVDNAANTVSVLIGTGSGAYKAPVSYSSGSAPYGVVVADVNGDSKRDVVVPAFTAGIVSVYLGNADGTLQVAPILRIDLSHQGDLQNCGYARQQIAVADFNGDTKADLAALNCNSISIAAGNGDGTYATPTAVAFASQPSAVAAGDLNADGKSDLVVASGGNVSVLLGKGDGTFQAAVDYPVGSDSRMITIADFNGDGKPDLAVADGTGTVYILLASGNGAFQAPTAIASLGTSIVTGDFNGDGKLDIAGASDTLRIALGSGNGSFQTSVQSSVAACQLVAADFNGDSKLDLVIRDCNTGGLSFLPGGGDGTFGTARPLTAISGYGFSGLAAADLNADGRVDLVAGFFGTQSGVAVFRNRGGGDFDVPVLYGEPGTTGVTVADANGDGKPDILSGSGIMAAFINTSVFVPTTTVASNPTGHTFTVDGQSYTAPQTFTWTPASTHTVQWVTQSEAVGTRSRFSNWADGNTSNPRALTASAGSATFTANFATQYQLTLGVSPAATGTLTATPSSADGYYDAGSSVQLNATPATGFSFQNYTGDTTGNAAQQSITMDRPRSVIAVFSTFSASGLVAGPASIQLTFVAGGGNPAPVPIGVASSVPGVNPNIPFVASVSAQTPWLSLGGSTSFSGTTPASFFATFDVSALGAQTYTGKIVLTPTGGQPLEIPVTLTGSSAPPQLTVTPSLPAFSYSIGTSATLPSQIGLSVNTNTPAAVDWNASVTINSGPLNWLQIQNSSGSVTNAAAQSLLASVNVAALAALNPGTYTASITFRSNAASNTPLAIPVSLTVTSAGLRFVPLTPCRVADTRLFQGTFGGPSMTGNSSRDFPIAGNACSVPANAQAFSLNVTVVPLAPLGFLSIWPAGSSRPLVSTLNSSDGRVKANAAIVPAGNNGAISVYVTDPSDVILDINGYFVPAVAPGSLAYFPVTPCRVMDTRGGAGGLGGPALVASAVRTVPVLQSSCAIPSTAQAYALNMTVVPKKTLAFLTTWPAGSAQPFVSTLNAPVAGTVVANTAIVPAGTAGSINVFATDDTDLVIDVNGYFAPPGASGYTFFTVSPCRAVDTRLSGSLLGGPALQAAVTRTFPVQQSTCGLNPAAVAYSLNATVVPLGPILSYLTLWPGGAAIPLASTLNSWDGTIASNAAIVPGGAAGGVSAFATDGTHLILDINGYFAP